MTSAMKGPRTKGLVSALSLLTVASLLGGCRDDASDAARLEVDGRAEVAHDGGDYEPAGDGALRADDRVRVVEGSAVLRLGDDRELELRAGSGPTVPGSEVELAPRANTEAGVVPSLLAGNLLVSAPKSELEVVVGDVEVSVADGTARVSQGLVAVAASYSGRLTVRSAGRSIVVPALRQVSVPAPGLLPSRPSPLLYQPSDPWDRENLGDAIDLGDRLAKQSKGFTAQLGTGEGRTPGFYRQILPALENEPAFDTAMLGSSRDPGEALVGLAITVGGRQKTFAERLRDVFDFHDQGAAWGLVALDQEVTSATLIAGVDAAIGRGPTIAAEGGAPPTRAPPTTVPPARAPAAPTPPRGSTRNAIGAPPTTTPVAEPPPGGGTLNTGVPLVDNTVSSLVDLLSGLLGGGRR